MRYALGASRGRIVAQLFVEALVLAATATVVGLAAADWGLQWVYGAFYSGQDQRPAVLDLSLGFKFTTMLYAAVLAVASAAMLWACFLRSRPLDRMFRRSSRTLAAGGSTLRFGGVWTTAMIAQVALTVICLPPAIEAPRSHCAIG